MEVKIKKLSEDAVIPAYAKAGDAGLDFTATKVEYDTDIDCIVYGTGLAVEIPEGHVGLLFPRSSISKYDLSLTNCVGVIDSGYRGEIMFKFKTCSDYIITSLEHFGEQKEENKLSEGKLEAFPSFRDIVLEKPDIKEVYKIGDRVGQMIIMPYPKVQFIEAEELSDSERGTGGYGSSN